MTAASASGWIINRNTPMGSDPMEKQRESAAVTKRGEVLRMRGVSGFVSEGGDYDVAG